ncbi:NUDIX domain-containing protein [Kineosporia sp. R_H_3]|uniref:NUDIX domain-containing protein n=1 Tax=Kineosporia sp. R_H_3 TaxID=1961848 RepID=UPI000B4A604F|nr:NUDIX domain-containing protein [Kineosporia sp. R_H_3]
MTDPLAVLARLYAGTPGLVHRAGATYPVAARRLPGARVVLDDRPRVVDAVLAEGGRPFLDGLRAGGRVHDGAVLCLDRVETPDGAGGSGGAVVRVVPGGYFDMLATCDAVRDEIVRAAAASGDGTDDRPDPTSLADLPLRHRAHEVAGDPTTSGTGRAAAFGVSVLLVVRTGIGDDGPHGETGVVLGLRSTRVGTDPGRWHVAPSGMLEPAGDGRHLATTVATELREELGVHRTVGEVEASLRVLGLVTDLARLRPDVVVLLDLAAVDRRPDAAELLAGEEFETLEIVPLTPPALATLWAGRPPTALTAAAAGALALLEDHLGGDARTGLGPAAP